EDGRLFLRGDCRAHWPSARCCEVPSSKRTPHVVVTTARDFVSTAMSEWREDNFLERLANARPERAGVELCPKAEVFDATVDSEGSATISDELLQHIRQCPVCFDLQNRLTLFDQADSLSMAPEVMETERRLDAWLKGFLASRKLRPAAQLVLAAPEKAPIFVPKPRPFLRPQWALAAAAMLVLAVGAVYIHRSTNVSLPRSEMARTTP